ncbi:MAG: MFS transporter [Methanobrevibacter sp.]
MTDSVLSISTFFYFIGDVIGLIFLARLSDYFGRKHIMELTLITALFGSIVFIFINGSSLLVLGRLIQGISCGISVSSIQTYVLDVSPKNSHLRIILSANLPTFGFAIGSLFFWIIC